MVGTRDGRRTHPPIRFLGWATVVTLIASAAACTSTAPRPAERPHAGGTLYYLQQFAGILHLDPQRDSRPADQAFASGYLQRTLTAYPQRDGHDATAVVPDLATDTGHPSDNATTWTFTLRPGVTFQTGAPITCADLKYGVSRAFATDTLLGASATAVAMLDIPRDAAGLPTYRGPYTTAGNDTAAFDRAVRCSPDGRTITFHLARPAADFNDTVATLTYSPVPRDADTKAGYDAAPVSSGPYEIAAYTPGSSLTLTRNPHWNRASDPLRPAYPDRVQVQMGLTDAQIQQRLSADRGADQAAVATGLGAQVADAAFGDPALAGRRFDGPDGAVEYLAINTATVTDVRQRQAIVTALDVAGINQAAGGDLAGTRADGLISPALSLDYRPTGLWTGLLGHPIPPHGDPAAARKLVAASGRPVPALTLDYNEADATTTQLVVPRIVDSLAAAGITVRPHPLSRLAYSQTIRDPATSGGLTLAAAAPDWPNASTIAADLLLPDGMLNLSRYDDPELTARVRSGQAQTDRAAQAAVWAQVNTDAMRQAVAVPLRFEHTQALVGSRVGGAFIWAPYGSLPFAALWVRPRPTGSSSSTAVSRTGR